MIDNQKFIEIYSRLLIIHELQINKDYHDQLVEELFDEYNITTAEVDSTVVYLSSHPREWTNILKQVKERIQEIREKISPRTQKITPREEPKSTWSGKKFLDKEEKKKLREKVRKQRIQNKEKKSIPEPQ